MAEPCVYQFMDNFQMEVLEMEFNELSCSVSWCLADGDWCNSFEPCV